MSFFSSPLKLDHARVTAAIVAAEKHTSGQIRVVSARHAVKDPIAAAHAQFDRLGMRKTSAHNGVLIFIAAPSRNFALIGDTGVHEKCGDPFWKEVAAAMTSYFKRGEFTEGLVHGIERAGALLAEHFPRSADDRNELPDTIEETD